MSHKMFPFGRIVLFALVEAAAASRLVGTLQAKAAISVTVDSTAKAATLLVSAGSPATLKEYCKGGGGAKMDEGAKVEADWRGMGTDYPGVIKDENKDGSFDILYDDGFVEKNVEKDAVKPVESEETADDPASDPACQLSDFVEVVKKKVDEAYGNIVAWVAHAKMKQEGREPPKFDPPVTTAPPLAAGAPAAAPASPAADPASPELEKLKKMLADRDTEIADLEMKVGKNDEEILGRMGLDGGSTPSGLKSVEQLIAEYWEKIKARDVRIKELKEQLLQQNEQLVAMGARTVDLSKIQGQVQDISELCDQARVKRDTLEKENNLDDELAHSLDHIFKSERKLRSKIGSLLDMERSYKEAAKERKAGGGKAEDKAAENEMLKTAMEVEKDMKDVQDSTKELDEGVHPHGDKWWRYRYERAYVEGLLLVLISIIMLIWERGYHFLRRQAYSRSKADTDLLTQGTMYIHWLEWAAGELMVCLLSFLTLWVLAKVHAFELLNKIVNHDALTSPDAGVHGESQGLVSFVRGSTSQEMHLPHTEAEYRRIAIDIAVVLFFAILFYFMMVLSVVHHATKKMDEWAIGAAALEKGTAEPSLGLQGSLVVRPGMARAETSVLVNEYSTMKNYFSQNIQKDAEVLKAIQEESGSPFDERTFPFWVYLRLNVRSTVDMLFMFGWTVWILIVLTFVGFCFLHRYAHVDYLRIMMTYNVVLGVIFISMMMWISKINKLVELHQASDEFDAKEHAPQCCRDHWVEGYVCILVHYVLFFLCYGAARMICQPWMWQFHFWPVFWLTCFTVILALVFMFVFAPMVPAFAAAMALPPFVDQENIQLLHHAHIRHAGTDANDYLESSVGSRQTPRTVPA